MAITMGVIVVLTMVTAFAVERSMSDVRESRREQDRSAAMEATDVAVGEASAMISGGQSSSFNGTNSVTTSGAKYWYRATKLSSTQWTVDAYGLSGGLFRSVSTTLSSSSGAWNVSSWRERRALAPFASMVLDSTDLQGYWRLGEASGSTAYDSSGYARNGTYSGVTLAQTGAMMSDPDTSASFNGTSSYVSLPSGFKTWTNGLTLSLWLYPTTSGSWTHFVEFGNGPTSDNILVTRSGTTSTFEYHAYVGASVQSVAAASAITNNTWQHFVVTHTAGGVVTIYKNGAQVATASSITLPPTVTRTQNYMARSTWVADAYYGGRVDDVSLWNRALTSTEVAALYNLGL